MVFSAPNVVRPSGPGEPGAAGTRENAPVDDTGVDKTGPALTPYPVGLLLAGRRVLVVGGGQVAQRRIPTLIAAGADVLVVSPEVTPAIEGLGTEITWARRRFEEADLE